MKPKGACPSGAVTTCLEEVSKMMTLPTETSLDIVCMTPPHDGNALDVTTVLRENEDWASLSKRVRQDWHNTSHLFGENSYVSDQSQGDGPAIMKNLIMDYQMRYCESVTDTLDADGIFEEVAAMTVREEYLNPAV